MVARKQDPLSPADLRAAITTDVDAELDRINVAEDEHRAALAAINREAEEIRAEYQRLAEAAQRDLKAVPSMPDLPDGQPYRDALSLLAWSKRDLAPRRLRALADAVPLVERSWDDARASLDGRAQEIAAAAEALATEYAAWWTLLWETRHAAEHADPNVTNHNGPSERMRPRPTAADVLEAASGVDLGGVGSAFTSRTLVTGKPSPGSR